jgi:hypothetical protein
MEAVRTSQTFVSTYRFTRRYNPEDQHRHFQSRENLKSHILTEVDHRSTFKAHPGSPFGDSGLTVSFFTNGPPQHGWIQPETKKCLFRTTHCIRPEKLNLWTQWINNSQSCWIASSVSLFGAVTHHIMWNSIACDTCWKTCQSGITTALSGGCDESAEFMKSRAYALWIMLQNHLPLSKVTKTISRSYRCLSSYWHVYFVYLKKHDVVTLEVLNPLNPSGNYMYHLLLQLIILYSSHGIWRWSSGL